MAKKHRKKRSAGVRDCPMMRDFSGQLLCVGMVVGVAQGMLLANRGDHCEVYRTASAGTDLLVGLRRD